MSIIKNTIPNIPRQKAPAIIHTPEKAILFLREQTAEANDIIRFFTDSRGFICKKLSYFLNSISRIPPAHAGRSRRNLLIRHASVFPKPIGASRIYIPADETSETMSITSCRTAFGTKPNLS